MWNTFYRQYQTDRFSLKLAGFVPADCRIPDLSCYDALLHFQPDSNWDGYDLDTQLNRLVSSLTPTEVTALGANIRLSHMPDACGGILGDPHQQDSSSEGAVEMLPCGLMILSYPGGPGCIASCSREQLNDLAEQLDSYADKTAKINLLRTALTDCEAFLIIDDASGPDSTGLLQIHNKETWRTHV